MICIPCYNCEAVIEEVIQPLLLYSDADILLVDDLSAEPLEHIIQRVFPTAQHRITVVRPTEKVYSGGGRNIGIDCALEQDYKTIIFIDSDIVTPAHFCSQFNQYFQDHPDQVIVGAAIAPAGERYQYADTVINFSDYLSSPSEKVSWKNCLAGYAFGLNLEVFRQKETCKFAVRTSGEDVLFFRHLQMSFGFEKFPLMNELEVIHKPPRCSLKDAKRGQLRYARSFFTHNDRRREYIFNKIPQLHLLTPRFWMMLLRVIKKGHFGYLKAAPRCWRLDFIRGREILRLCREKHVDSDGAVVAARYQQQPTNSNMLLASTGSPKD